MDKYGNANDNNIPTRVEALKLGFSDGCNSILKYIPFVIALLIGIIVWTLV